MTEQSLCPRCGSGRITIASTPTRVCPHCILSLGLTDAREAPAEIPGYDILSRLGEGGMGVVYRAWEGPPLNREVALKVMRRGLDSIAAERFRFEAENLARMEHPSVAKVFRAGVSQDHLPYLAMEFVHGEHVTDFCDVHRLAIPQRLEVFRRICEAVVHAHQKGLIHRDLKPSNILVARVDDAYLPKIIDFGIACLAKRQAGPDPRFTRTGETPGTTPYMSPERANGPIEAVDTRADVYSLGMVLYELLAGALPYPADAYEGNRLDVLKLICETDVPLPSERFARLGDDRGPIAGARGTTPAGLAKTLRRDLDAIVMRSLEKIPSRRYANPADLSADLSRWLRHEPVTARPPSVAYRAAKFVRRHRAATSLALVVAASVTWGFVANKLYAARVARERDRANAEALAANQVASFMVDIFRSRSPANARGTEPTVREAIDRGALKVQTDLKEQPAVQSRLMAALGQVYLTLGRFDEGRKQIEGSLERRRAIFGPRSLEVAESLDLLGHLECLEGYGARAEPSFKESLAIREAVFGVDSAEAAASLRGLADARWFQDDLEGARSFYERALSIEMNRFGPESTEAGLTRKDLADIAYVQGDYRRALPLYRQSRVILERNLGKDQPKILNLYTNFGSMLLDLRRYDEARPLLKAALEIAARILPPDHPEVAGSLNNYGRVLLHDGKYDLARSDFEHARAISEKQFGHQHRDVALSLDNLGALYLAQGRYADAARTLADAYDVWTRTVGLDHVDAAMTLNRIAIMKSRTGDSKGANALFEKVLVIRREKLPEIHPDIAGTLEAQAQVLDALGRGDEARRNRAHAREIWDQLAAL